MRDALGLVRRGSAKHEFRLRTALFRSARKTIGRLGLVGRLIETAQGHQRFRAPLRRRTIVPGQRLAVTLYHTFPQPVAVAQADHPLHIAAVGRHAEILDGRLRTGQHSAAVTVGLSERDIRVSVAAVGRPAEPLDPFVEIRLDPRPVEVDAADEILRIAAAARRGAAQEHQSFFHIAGNTRSITEHPPQIILSLDTAAIRGKRQVFDRLFCIGLHADPLVETDAEPELRFRKRGRRRLAETLDRRGRIPRGAGAVQGTIPKIEFGQRRARLCRFFEFLIRRTVIRSRSVRAAVAAQRLLHHSGGIRFRRQHIYRQPRSQYLQQQLRIHAH